MGTNNKALIGDENYIGLRQTRLRGSEYDMIIEEFMTAAKLKYGANVLFHVKLFFSEFFFIFIVTDLNFCFKFEDFGQLNAQRLLDKHCDSSNCFNDDIQGTAAVVLAGVLAANRIPNDIQNVEFIYYA